MVKKKRAKKKKSSAKPRAKKKESEIKVEKILIENFVELQKVLTHMSFKFEGLTKQISELLKLFETSAKFAKGLSLMHEGNQSSPGSMVSSQPLYSESPQTSKKPKPRFDI